LRDTQARGEALYAREIVGPTDSTVLVKDSVTGIVRSMIMMGSNNYLGLANHPEVKQAVKDSIDENGVGMGGPPLLNGMSATHRELEQALARLKQKEDALIFASGFQANLGWIGSLLRSQDHFVFDELHHASVFDGVRAARSVARFRPHSMKHNDHRDLERILKKIDLGRVSGSQVFVAVEGVYSMDGDLAPLPEIAALCKTYRANLVVDDAHGTGVLGQSGGGTARHYGIADQVDLAMGTFSKAFGVTGGFIAGKKEVIDYLRYFSRSYMFSAHIPQSVAAAVLAGVKLLARDSSLQDKLRANVKYLVGELKKSGFVVKSESAIIPIILPPHVDARKLGGRLHQEGIFANVIEAPAVPKESQRIRLSVMTTHTFEQLDQVVRVLTKLSHEFKLT
jgi:glycine C-acetyltransferase